MTTVVPSIPAAPVAPPKGKRPIPEMTPQRLATHRMLASAQGTIEEMAADAAAAVKRLQEAP